MIIQPVFPFRQPSPLSLTLDLTLILGLKTLILGLKTLSESRQPVRRPSRPSKVGRPSGNGGVGGVGGMSGVGGIVKGHSSTSSG